jgi:glycine/D-amino acid oxidase-like deaminating enzyme
MRVCLRMLSPSIAIAPGSKRISQLFTDDYKDLPYWQGDAARPDTGVAELPGCVDVAVVGSGYTGLNTAIQTARAGRSTLVLDAQDAGWGCSSRNGGQVSTSFKPSLETLSKTYGPQKAFQILREGHNALDWIGAFIDRESIDCGFERVGRFHGAHNSRQYEQLARICANQPAGLEVEAHMVPRDRQAEEIETDVYHGGIVYSQHASLHPAKYHSGLLEIAQRAGAQIAPHTRVENIERERSGFVVHTSRGKLRARDVAVATGGYTGALSPWHERRIIPIGSYIIATEPMEESLVDQLLPTNRVYSDTRKLVYYYRASPDRTRIIFGGRVCMRETNPRVSAPLLRAELVRLLPALASVRISHSWMGFVGYTFDSMPHIGRHEGIYYSMGYCGSGVSLASYFGMRLGEKIAGIESGETGLDETRFESRPYYFGKPWFLSPSIFYYRIRDRLNI